MSASYTVPPFYDVLQLLADEIFKSLRCLMPAKITAVNTAAGTVDVQISALQQTPTGKVLSYPPLSGLPIITMQGSGAHLKFPIRVGDQCLVFFADRCMAAWKQTGSPQPLPNPRMHDLSDGFALIGVNSPIQLVTLLASAECGIATATAKVGIDTDTNQVVIANGVAGVNNLKTILTDFTTAVNALNTALTALNVGIAAESGTIPTAAAAATTANTAIALVTTSITAVATKLGLLLK